MKTVAVCLMCCFGLSGVHAQDLIRSIGSTRPIPFQDDLAVLEDRMAHRDIPCTLVAAAPHLDLDLKFHTGYEVSLPLRELAGVSPATLTVVFRVTPEAAANGPVFFSQSFKVPPIHGQMDGEVQLGGAFVVGQGRYSVDWLLRDARQRVCSLHWDLNAKLSGRDREVPLAVGPGVVQPSPAELFENQSRPAAGPLSVKILVNFAPQEEDLGILPKREQEAIVAILHTIGREPRIGHFSVIAFNLRDEQILYHQSDTPRIDFPGLGRALHARPPGTIDIRRLAMKDGPAEFLRTLIAGEIGRSEGMDAVILAGPKTVSDYDISPESIRLPVSLPCPMFYLNYNATPDQATSADVIGKMVRFLKGRVYAIAHPRDVWLAWRDIMSQLSAGSVLSAAAR